MRYLLSVVLFCVTFQVQAQNTYSYVSDRKFKDPTDLIGYHFRPASLEIPQKGIKEELAAGSYSFSLSGNNLYIKGEKIQGVYNVNTVNTTDYGFIMKFINARDARIQGHLKVILNGNGQVDALVFRRTQQEPEMIFFQKLIDPAFEKQEMAYFTDIHEMSIESTDSIWGKIFRPFLRINPAISLQERLRKPDSTFIAFEKITITDEKVRTKKLKQDDPIPEVGPNETVTVDTASRIATITETLISYRYQIRLETILTKTDGGREKLTDLYRIRSVRERVDELARMDEPRFQIEFKTEANETLYLFLLGDRTVSSFTTGGTTLWARGY